MARALSLPAHEHISWGALFPSRRHWSTRIPKDAFDSDSGHNFAHGRMVEAASIERDLAILRGRLPPGCTLTIQRVKLTGRLHCLAPVVWRDSRAVCFIAR